MMRIFALVLALCSSWTSANTLKYRNVFHFSMNNVESFKWSNCGGDAAGFSDLMLTPDPLQFPGTLSITAKAFFNATVMAPLPASLLVEKQVGTKFVKIPCIDNFGSCDYDDLCELLDEIECPQPLVNAGIPCQCPFKVAKYELPKADFEVDTSFFPSGNYHLKGSVSMMNTQAGCLDLFITVA